MESMEMSAILSVTNPLHKLTKNLKDLKQSQILRVMIFLLGGMFES